MMTNALLFFIFIRPRKDNIMKPISWDRAVLLASQLAMFYFYILLLHYIYFLLLHGF